ncbi:hypothetical protein [Pedobacter rhodius]|uniref:Uncharacterized protein n=1 Tax=Pedobacter rhodius TaxID=3004098 RepID=A0ABT4KWD6_9SPHI|nr:hypothetical protein [Pedobacter sp. SJ11]MCZ4223254.1 hypothetical protein [Pedobacter sp. SJ11]
MHSTVTQPDQARLEEKFRIVALLIHKLRNSYVSIGFQAPRTISLHFKTEITQIVRRNTFRLLEDLNKKQAVCFEVYVRERLITPG